MTESLAIPQVRSAGDNIFQVRSVESVGAMDSSGVREEIDSDAGATVIIIIIIIV